MCIARVVALFAQFGDHLVGHASRAKADKQRSERPLVQLTGRIEERLRPDWLKLRKLFLRQKRDGLCSKRGRSGADLRHNLAMRALGVKLIPALEGQAFELLPVILEVAIALHWKAGQCL